MNIYDELLNFIKSQNNDSNIFDNPSEYDIYIDSYFDSVLSCLLNKIKGDGGHCEELYKISQIKKGINKESRKQYNVVISCSKKSEKTLVTSAIRKIVFLNFFNVVVRILDLDNDYLIKVNECKKYFGNSTNWKIFKLIHDKDEIHETDLIELTGENAFQLDVINDFPELISKKIVNDSTVYCLSAKAKNLYAFYMMKNINFNDSNFNEGKVNEVLEYLIEYIATSPKHPSPQKKPVLHSISANYNLDKITALIDNNSYSQHFVEKPVQKNDSFNWEGGQRWDRA